MTVREQIMKEVANTEDSRLLQELLEVLESRQQHQPDQPRRGSYEAFMQFRGTLSDAEAQEMRDTINREFNTIEGEW